MTSKQNAKQNRSTYSNDLSNLHLVTTVESTNFFDHDNDDNDPDISKKSQSFVQLMGI
jgi:hypothetical protein